MKIDVLDHGFVRLVSYMQPVPEAKAVFGSPGETHGSQPGGWTGDLEVVRNARVSYDADWRDQEGEKDSKLLKYMYDNFHTSPFEAMVFTFEIKCPLFIARQWHRHRTWSYNEVSARYAEVPADWYVPDPEIMGKQSATNKQAREITKATMHARTSKAIMGIHHSMVYDLYQQLLNDQDVPRELARSVLPQAMYTRFFGTVDLHNLIHFLRLRADPHAQWEIQQYAHGLFQLIQPIVPIIADLIKEDLKL